MRAGLKTRPDIWVRDFPRCRGVPSGAPERASKTGRLYAHIRTGLKAHPYIWVRDFPRCRGVPSGAPERARKTGRLYAHIRTGLKAHPYITGDFRNLNFDIV